MPARTAAPRRPDRRRSRLAAMLVSSPVAFGLLIVALLASGWNYLVAESSRDRVAEANGVLLEVERLFSSIKDLETGERGFVLVGGENYLVPYDGAIVAIDASLATLRRISHGGLRASLAGGRPLETLVAEKRDFAARVVALRREQGFEAATELVRTGEGKRVMDAIRAEAGAIRRRLSDRVERIQASDRLRGLLLALLTGAASWSAVVLLAGLLFRRPGGGPPEAALTARLFERAPVGLGAFDRERRLLHANRALAALGGDRLGQWETRPGGARLGEALDAAFARGATAAGIAVTVPSPEAPGGARHLRLSVFPLSGPDAGGGEAVGLAVAEAPPS